MSVDMEQYRAKIGIFAGGDPARQRKLPKIATLRIPLFNCKVLLTVRLCLLSLLVLGGNVERNPGPPKLRSVTQEAATKEDQAGILEKLNLLIRDTQAINVKLDCVQTRMNNIEDEMHGLKEFANQNRDKLNSLEEQQKCLGDIQDSIEQLKRENEKLRRDKDDLENKSRRNNLVFYGVKQDSPNETWEEAEKKIKSLLENELNMTEDIEFERCHRLKNARATRGPLPIIAMLSKFKDKGKVLKSAHKLRGTDISIGEDFSERIRNVRSKLIAYRKSLTDSNKSLKSSFATIN